LRRICIVTKDRNTCSANTASGFYALFSNTTGLANTATGFIALNWNETGTRNTATGAQALWFNTTGSRDTATGFDALAFNDSGNHNSAYGWVSLYYNTTGNLNTAFGDAAGYNLQAGDNNIYIANQGVTTESNTIRIGNQTATVLPDGTAQPAQTATYVAGIYGVGVTGVPVKINAASQLGTPPSSARFKEQIKPMDKTSEAILALRPVTFLYKKEIDPERGQQFGLVAEEVAKINRI
jgi:hypothetical protein